MAFVGQKKYFPYLLLLPAILLVALVSFVPLLHALRVSVSDTRYLAVGSFNQFEHFRVFLGSIDGARTIGRSWYHVAGTVALALPYAFVIAFALNREYRWKPVRTTFRSILILPFTVSWLIAAFLWIWMLNPHYGVVSYFSQVLFGVTTTDPTKSTTFAMPTLISVTAWRLYPLAVLFILADLQTIPEELKQAATIDGASGWQIFTLIVFPLIRNTVLVVAVLLTLDTFNMVTLTLQLTGGGPGTGTMTLALRAFRESFFFWRIGSATAIAVIIFLFNIFLSLVYVRVLKTERYY